MKSPPRFDKPLLTAVGILVLFGLIALSSASGIRGFNQYRDTYYFLKRQIFYGVIPGLIIGYIFWLKGYRYIERLAVPLLLLIILLLILVFVPRVGHSSGTFANRWVQFGAL